MNTSTGTEKLIEQALTRADEIGVRAWTELVHYYFVSGVVQSLIGVGLIAAVGCAARLLIRHWDDLDEPEMFAVMGGILGAIALIVGLLLVGDGITYLLAPGGAALHEVLK